MSSVRANAGRRVWGPLLGLSALTVGLFGCGSEPEPAPRVLGPVDGEELVATDLERVAVGAQAPDFVLASLGGDTIGLSDYAGESPVVLVFYRGHW